MTPPDRDPDSLETYSYDLPEELIAKEPPERRDGARLMVLDREQKTIEHRTIRDLPALLRSGDRLVLNDTRVVPARIVGERAATGGRWEGLFLRRLTGGNWEIIGQTRGRLTLGETITLRSIHRPADVPPLSLQLVERGTDGVWIARPGSDLDAFELLDDYGTVPLPPYMHRKVADESDWSRYQTTFARTPGSVAAPTAGLHFTPELLDRCAARGITNSRVTLHVGIGTFRPVSVEKLSQHDMHSEWCVLPEATAAELIQTRQTGGRIVGVGTTSVRTLESVAARGPLVAWQGETNLFIRPPYKFRAIDCLLTNFHLPKSTLFVLVCALAGTDFVKEAYRQAISERYRFFSYGDAMLVL
ncbi:tRNA preQ1(34) S-adenosylmethionine ribosyltransferase-isomerase QueA [bacterium]|nr:tRNA preQ1(34) S-adenosylmethionine ribosyltransferase-isomerase QueA [bacterium]